MNTSTRITEGSVADAALGGSGRTLHPAGVADAGPADRSEGTSADVPSGVAYFIADTGVWYPGVTADSEYVEMFWLPTIGPTATWVLRRVVAGLVAQGCQGPLETDVYDLAASLGVQVRTLHQALDRLVRFGLAWRDSEPLTWRVRVLIPRLPARHLARYPRTLQLLHDRY